ncbi:MULTISPECIES: hypothetical protein [Eubacteriales]|uniref:Uncharacterized protein n=1 Tax=Bittarella massiliensis (ex Durand et al. 2017) TaxID=1720313 RepID=A0AAQ1MFV3_9FIRM|nr:MULTISPECIES: hypothetical protein [Eubacteriales]ERI99620.1 hypothetical protein HMPREF0262_01651 [Clostridium sp. ATCC 29733]MZL68346.1 hypothetical protein [Bittarella massiliensis (ex Durand et al. 2017)]MZL79599.1 hypothetical protein [Bittarella massiliensis (ex Durand et al. 2017)]SHG63734.1 hypothetical protein SAMN05444424_2886 [Bittarella massiliensis (ex Durand et al. 2017)]
MSRRNRSAAFYVETAITLFFLLCTAAVIAQLFSTALQSSHLAEEMTRAEFAAEEEAERLAAAPTLEDWAAAVQGAGAQLSQDGDRYTARLLLGEGDGWVLVELQAEETAGGRLARAQISAGRREKASFSLESGRYWQGEGGQP